MKSFLLILSMLLSIGPVLGQDTATTVKINLDSNEVTVVPVSTESDAGELLRLKKNDAILKAILENSSYIQLNDGRVLEIRKFEKNLPINDIRVFDRLEKSVNGGGTGGGG